MSYEDLVQLAIRAMTRAIVVYGKQVGAAVRMKDGTVIQGFNIENKSYKGYHAEEVAVISALKMGYTGNDFESIAIVCSFKGLYPACGHCRQMLWEYTNPDLIIIAYDLESAMGQSFVLKDLYPFPYPLSESIKTIEPSAPVKVDEVDKGEGEGVVEGNVISDVQSGMQEG